MPKSAAGVTAVPWTALKPSKDFVPDKAVTGKLFLKEAQVSMFGGLLATDETKNKSATKTVARTSAQKKVRDLARDHRTALSVWRPQLLVLRGEYEMVAERAEEAKQALKEVQKQAKGIEGSTLVAVAQSMVDMQEARIEEDTDRCMEFSYQVRDGEKSEAIAVRDMALYLTDTKGLSHHDKISNQYFDKADKKIQKEETLNDLMGRGSGSNRSHYCDSGSDDDANMTDGDEVDSFRTSSGVLMARGAHGLGNSIFAARLEITVLGFDLARLPPHSRRRTAGY